VIDTRKELAMPLLIPTPEQALLGLRAMKTVITANGPLDATRRALVSAVQKYVLNTQLDFEALPIIDPSQLAAELTEPRLRDQLSRALCLYVMIPDSPARVELDLTERFVRALGGASDALERMRSGYDPQRVHREVSTA
jgi:hypothetical protein